MAGHNATGKKARRGPELVQRSRAAILNALDVLEERGKTISVLLADELENNPIRFMELASKFCPKELDVSTAPKTPEQMSDAELYELIKESRAILESIGSVDTTEGEGAEQVH